MLFTCLFEKKVLNSGKTVIQLCESRRIDGKVHQRILRHVGTAGFKDSETLTKLIDTATFLKNELEANNEKIALEIEPNLPIDIPEKPIPSPHIAKELKEFFSVYNDHRVRNWIFDCRRVWCS